MKGLLGGIVVDSDNDIDSTELAKVMSDMPLGAHVAVLSIAVGQAIAAMFSGRGENNQRDLVVEINSIKDEFDDLKGKIYADANRDVIESELLVISEKLDRVKAQSESLVAPIKLPALEDMAIELVPSHSLDRLDEYRSDLNWLYSFLGLSGGGVISVLVGWAASGAFSWSSVSLLLLLVIVTVLLGFAVWRTQSRSRRIRETMVSSSKLRGGDLSREE